LKTSDGLVTLASTITDANGYYEFLLVAPGDYMLDASTTKPWGGVDAIDAFVIYYNGGLLTGLYAVAADVDENGLIDAIDAFIVYLENPSSSNWTAPEWIFENPIITVNVADVYQYIFGICSGDVDGSYNP